MHRPAKFLERRDACRRFPAEVGLRCLRVGAPDLEPFIHPGAQIVFIQEKRQIDAAKEKARRRFRSGLGQIGKSGCIG